jgi:hypothetical protein
MTDTELLLQLKEIVKEHPGTVARCLMWIIKSDGEDKPSIRELEELIK